MWMVRWCRAAVSLRIRACRYARLCLDGGHRDGGGSDPRLGFPPPPPPISHPPTSGTWGSRSSRRWDGNLWRIVCSSAAANPRGPAPSRNAAERGGGVRAEGPPTSGGVVCVCPSPPQSLLPPSGWGRRSRTCRSPERRRPPGRWRSCGGEWELNWGGAGAEPHFPPPTHPRDLPHAHQVSGLVPGQAVGAELHHPPEAVLLLAPAQAPDGEAGDVATGHFWGGETQGTGAASTPRTPPTPLPQEPGSGGAGGGWGARRWEMGGM